MPTTSLWPVCGGKKGSKGAISQVLEYIENENKTVEKAKNGEKECLVFGVTEGMEAFTDEPSIDDQKDKGQASDEDPAVVAVGSVIKYVSDKNEGLKYVSGINCVPESATKKMVYTRKMFGEKGRRILWHGYQAFAPGESTPDKVHQMGVELAEKLWGDRFEVVVATHLDRHHLHNHFVINATSFLDGKKFNWDIEYPRMQKESDLIANREGCSLVDAADDISSKREWWRKAGVSDAENSNNAVSGGQIGTDASMDAGHGRYTIERIVREDIDDCIRYASDLDVWKTMMRARGYLIDDSRKYLRIYPYGHSRCIRVDRRFGDDYTLEGIERRILEREQTYLSEEIADSDNDSSLDEETGSDPNLRIGRLYDHENQDDISKLYAELGGGIFHGPEGLQLLYIRFIIDMGGYYRRRGRAARTHFLLREELARLDKYIDESRFLIRENINTSDELNSIVIAEQHKLKILSKERKSLNSMIRSGKSDEIEGISDRLDDIKLLMKSCKKNIKYCVDILHRSENMQRKRKLIEQQNNLYSEEVECGIVMTDTIY